MNDVRSVTSGISRRIFSIERKKISAAHDEANERRQSEVYALTLKLDAMRSRSTAAEKLLAEMRQSLVARTEEIRVAEGKLVEATVGRSGARLSRPPVDDEESGRGDREDPNGCERAAPAHEDRPARAVGADPASGV